MAGKARSPVASPVTRHPSLTVTPDFVFREMRLALFVDGCFWHGCPKHGTNPKGNAAFWAKKFAANKARDARVNRALRRAGWRVLRVWEHELKQSGKRKAEGGTAPNSESAPEVGRGMFGKGMKSQFARKFPCQSFPCQTRDRHWSGFTGEICGRSRVVWR